MLPVGVLIPTRNCMALLPAHVESMQAWLDQVEEIVVVDSHSRDGTKAFLQQKLAGRNVRFLDHPPGLYESWNFGLARITAPFTYISTVGDVITPAGLRHLAGLAHEEACDLVISPPEFVDERGQPIANNSWPVHDMISFMQLKEPVCMEGLVTFAVALSFLPFALLGSSASNLFRTSVLRQHPFPTEFGMNGDGAWGLFNALNIRLGITPMRCSTFRRHRKSYSFMPYAADADQRMLDQGLRLLGEFMRERPQLKAQEQKIGMSDFIAAKVVVQQWRATLNWHRKLPWPWILNALAWRARRQRDTAQRHCEALVKRLLAGQPEVPAAAPAALAAT